MTPRIEDYALIGDSRTAALVHRDGTIAWLCLPCFDSGACFASLLGTEENGLWRLGPVDPNAATTRRYLGDSLVLETTHETADGRVRVFDAFDVLSDRPRVLRRVVGERGRVRMRTEIRLRFDYGSVVPWVHRVGPALVAIAGADACVIYSDVALDGVDHRSVAEFSVGAGESVAFELASFASYERFPGPSDVGAGLQRVEMYWRDWTRACTYAGPHREAVVRSLITLRALADRRTGAVVAAPTTSLPEKFGGVRNWDYRYCWLRDATFVLVGLLNAGYEEEAFAWRDWLLRAAAGNPRRLQIMYGLRGDRHLPERELDHLGGFAGSRPVRVGNAASQQFQLDVYGEVVDVMYQAHRAGLSPGPDEWMLTRAVVEAVETKWREQDRGLWEVRGPNRDFVHSKVLAWVALDRAVAGVEQFMLDGPVDRWRALRAQIHEDVCRHGFDAKRGTFTQYYGSRELDAATLLIPLVGFLGPEDERVRGTIAAVERELLVDGFVRRYTTAESGTDGLPPGEGAFYACGYWLADNYLLQGRRDDATALFDRLAATANDLGLLAEEYDVEAKQMVGNFPQAFSHVGLINTATALARRSDAAQRSSDSAGAAAGRAHPEIAPP